MINTLPGFVVSTDWNGKEYKVAAQDLVWRPAAYAIVVKDKKILLTKQRGEYHLPGGGIDRGEMPADAVVREVKEETGIIVNEPILVDMISGFFTWKDTESGKLWHYQSVLLYYHSEYIGGELSIDGFEAEEKSFGEIAEWIPIANLNSIKLGSTIDWLSVVKKVLAL